MANTASIVPGAEGTRGNTGDRLRDSMGLPVRDRSPREQVLFEIVRGLRQARHRKGLSQAEVAERMGVPQSNVARLESVNSKRMPTVWTVAKYLAACEAKLVIAPNSETEDATWVEAHFGAAYEDEFAAVTALQD